MRPDTLSALAVFRVVALERSFTRAATRLGFTQSALSQTMKRLEAEPAAGPGDQARLAHVVLLLNVEVGIRHAKKFDYPSLRHSPQQERF